MELDPTTLSHQSIYKILTGSILPRPIGWISSIDLDGRPNLAPFSFFNVVCSNPPTLLFCPMIRGMDSSPKDTLNNVRQTGEFVVNIVTEDLLNAMNDTSIEAPSEFNEFEFAGLTLSPSVTVRPPRVLESPIHFECKVNQILDINNAPGGGSIVIGTITHIHAEERVMLGTDKINLTALQPIGRLMGAAYCRVEQVVELDRPKNILGGPA
ncbi:MAG: flavin reductase family protein [Anaerolineales bacterium]|nr:flavin reductase family protein [Anaerolineales bacterium]MBP6211073.1 flavin reductase family protein [Anaerolineales bacterium]